MLCGDFNIDLLNKDCNNSTSFLNTMYSLSLLPIINKPTRIPDNSATLIDNFFINEPCNELFFSLLMNSSFFPPPLKPRCQGKAMGIVGGGGNIAISTALPPSFCLLCCKHLIVYGIYISDFFLLA